ncbi:MAG: FecR domain-containing protein [Cyclobacteriaceae bacterium]
MPKKDFTEFLENEKFIRWVVNPNTESDHFWKNWIASHPERKEDIKIARDFLHSVEYKTQYKLDDTKYTSGLYRLMDLHETESKKTGLSLRRFWKTMGIAAMITLTAFAGYYLQQPSTSPAVAISPKEVIKQTAFGQKQIIRLPDGSTVHLNAGSKLTYSNPFNDQERVVSLIGEAFFEVARDEQKPFIIRAGALSTKVLGTSFNVRAYPDEQRILVSVESGKVGVNLNEGVENIIVNPQEQVTYLDTDKTLRVSSFDRQEVLGWIDGIIQFNDLPLSKVIAKLERVYGVEFYINNPNLKLEEKYSGVYKNAPLDRILQGISFAVGFDYELNDKIVTIKSKNE